MSELRDLRNVNLNLLPVLRELLRYGSVTEAAKALHLSQSSVSGSLKVLREHFGDDLIVSVGRKATLSAYARELVAPVEDAMGAMVEVLFRREFDPEAAQGRFYVATVDYLASVVGPPLAETLQASFPGLSVQIVQIGPHTWSELQTGEVDLVLTASDATGHSLEQLGLDPTLLVRQQLWVDEMIGIARAGVVPPVTVDDFGTRPHVSFQIAPGVASIEGRLLARLHVARHERLIVPHLHLLPTTVMQTDCVSVVPVSLARCFAKVMPLQVFPLPFETPSVPIEMVWMARDDDSPRQRWLRDTVSRVVSEIDHLHAP